MAETRNNTSGGRVDLVSAPDFVSGWRLASEDIAQGRSRRAIPRRKVLISRADFLAGYRAASANAFALPPAVEAQKKG
jgi:hypothetical protein